MRIFLKGIIWKNATVQDSYWDYVLEHCGLHVKISLNSGHKCIYHYLSEIYKVFDENGIKKYP